MKKCTKCKQLLEVNATNSHRSSKNNDGFAYYCKSCIAEGTEERRKKIDETINNIKPQMYKNNGRYKVINNVKAPGSASRLYKSEFNGEVIYQDNRLLTLKNDRGIRETFLKVDFEIGEYQIQSI